MSSSQALPTTIGEPPEGGDVPGRGLTARLGGLLFAGPALIVLGIFLVYLTLAGFISLLKTPQFQNALFVFGILIGLLWWLWSLLPEWFRKLVRRSHSREERGHER